EIVIRLRRKSVQLFWPEICLLVAAGYLLFSHSGVLHLSSSFSCVFIFQKVLIQEQVVLRVHFFVWRIKKWRKLKPQRIGRRKMIDFWFIKKG
ncbi:hypothetical protein LINGRAHAP2_LOCUS31724, partial [Linum grandiflorum]